jgi:hypothetical protein
MKLKIISNGQAIGTKIINADTGEEIEGIVSVKWQIDGPGELSKMELQFINIPVEVEGIVEDTVIGEGTRHYEILRGNK